jgi:hypothetical protein
MDSHSGTDPVPEIGCSRLSHFNLYSFIFGKKYGKVDYDGQDPLAEGRNRRLAVTQLCCAGGQEYNPVMKPYAQEAENLRLLFKAGIVSIDEVVDWADRTILALPEYDCDLTEISLGVKVPVAEMDRRLRRVSEGANHSEAIRNLAGRMHRILLSDRSRARDFARVLERLYGENPIEIPWDHDFMACIFEPFSGNPFDRWSRKDAINHLIAETAPFDKATPVPMPPLPASRPSQSESSQKWGKGVRERLLRFFRGGQK